ncbi:MAG: NADPH-dependent F420 reductase [Pyrinomonadaceae bacterium]
MKIGIIGAGNIGSNAAKIFAEAGHKVAIANSRGPETLTELVGEIGGNAKAVTVEEAIDFGEMVFISIPFGRYKELPADKFGGKIVIDSNNYYPKRDGNFEEIDSNKITSSELLAEHLSGAKVVKAFNTIWFEHLKTQGNKDLPKEERRVIFVSGDDSDAKKKVSELIEEIGFGAFDAGNLSEGGKTQSTTSAVYNRDLTVAEVDGVLYSSY